MTRIRQPAARTVCYGSRKAMDPMLDPDLVEFLDDESLLTAFAPTVDAAEFCDRAVLLAEINRRDLHPAPPILH